MNRYDAVTFDMGYTLVHFHPSEEELYRQALHSLGVDPDPGALRQVRDRVWRDYSAGAVGASFVPTEERDWELEEQMMRLTLRELGLGDPALARSALRAVKGAFRQPDAVRLYPEALEVLAALRAQGHALGIISNWSWDLPDYVRLVGLDGHFDVVIASARAGCEKPHPAIFRQALQALGCRPERAIHVGDSYESDVAGARGVGMEALWLDRQGKGGHSDCCSIGDLRGVLAALVAGGEQGGGQ